MIRAEAGVGLRSETISAAFPPRSAGTCRTSLVAPTAISSRAGAVRLREVGHHQGGDPSGAEDPPTNIGADILRHGSHCSQRRHQVGAD